MLRQLAERPSLAVGACALCVLTFFVVRGDLRVHVPANASTAPSDAAPAGATVPAPRPVVVRPDRAARAAVPPTALRARVFDALGFLVVHATIEAAGSTLRSDADGAFRVEPKNGRDAEVLVRGVGLRPVWCRLQSGAPDEAVVLLEPVAPWDAQPVALPPLGALRGEGLVRGDGGRPLAGAFVTVPGFGSWARSDEFGRFTIALPAAATPLLVHAPDPNGQLGGHAALSEPFASERSSGVVPLPELAAAAASTLRGVVRDPAGVPIEGVPVRVRGSRLERVLWTGQGGTFCLSGLLPDDYEVQPCAHRGAVGVAANVALTGPVAQLDQHLVAIEDARLRVVDEAGSPAAGVWVATASGGMRRGVAQAATDGTVAVPIAAVGTTFDVRTSGTFAPLVVRRYEADAGQLVVALP